VAVVRAIRDASDPREAAAELRARIEARASERARIEESERRTEDEIARAITTGRGPTRPLSAICMKMLARDRAGRYATAGEMAQDLENWLVGRPVSAKPQSAWPRIAKRLRRLLPVAALPLVDADHGPRDEVVDFDEISHGEDGLHRRGKESRP
jgi:hypothetical protein